MPLLIFGTVLPWLVVGLCVWATYQLLQQQGRILLRLQALEERLAELGTAAAPTPAPTAPAAAQGLPMGSPAPAFELPDLSGERRSLADFSGQPRLLVFFNPRCGFCSRMAADLAGLPVDGRSGAPVPLVVSTGDAEENRRFFTEHGVRCPVLLQEKMEVAGHYGCHGTPMGYLLDAEGRIAGEMAVGAEALLALARGAAAPPPAAGESVPHPEPRGNRALAESKLNRSGLKAGTRAPAFRVPDLAEGEVALDNHAGNRVLLVFSAPNCGPCSQVAPQLERLHRSSAEVRVVMVSRGGLEENRRKAEEQHLTFPIGVQRHWEVSREYALFLTPVAYLIDGAGTIERDPAVGADAVLALIEEVTEARAEDRCRCGKRVLAEGGGPRADAGYRRWKASSTG
jgi:peroxiredoxin